MRSRLLILVLLALQAAPVAAEPSWVTLPDAPFRTNDRHEDVWFLNKDLGWVVNAAGEVWHTSDGGDSWTLRADTGRFNRSVTFLTPEVGFIGALYGSLTFGSPLLRTTDGGWTWTPLTDLPTVDQFGICGMWNTGPQAVWAVGRYNGPPTVLRSLDKGKTWKSFDVSAHVDGIVDCYFPEPHRGFLAGSVGSFPNESVAVVLQTTDGGESWAVKHKSSRAGEWSWKISFPTESVGYVSMQRFGSFVRCLKTTDAGETWAEQLVVGSAFNTEGIGFVTPELGWIGGIGNLALRTTNGGALWISDRFARNLNRVRVLRPDLAFAVGSGVYRWSENAGDVRPVPETRLPGTNLSVSPNPFAGATEIRFVAARAGEQQVFIHDVAGRRLKTLFQGHAGAGEATFRWDGTDDQGGRVAPGAYFVRIETAERRESRDVILIR